MKTMTLLEIVQNILSSMNSDVVSSINETTEARQVATVVQDVYYSICDEYNITGNKNIGQLDATSGTKPNYMKLPKNAKHLISLKYDTSIDSSTEPVYTTISYLTPDIFINLVTSRRDIDNNIEYIEDPSGVKLPILNNIHPTYYTSFDNETIVFDSYDITQDTQLQNSKTLAYMEQVHDFQFTNDYKISLPEHVLSLFYNEAKSNCFVTIKQVSNPKVDQQSQRLRYNLQRQKDRVDNEPRRIAYGRR